MAALSYMQRRTSGIYEFRKRLPLELAAKPVPPHLRPRLAELINPTTGHFKRELTVSLKTADYRLAKRLDLREAVRVTDLLALASRLMNGGEPEEVGASPSPEQIEADIITALLRADEEEREEGDPRRQLQTPEERAAWPDLTDPGFGTKGMAEGHLELLDLHTSELVGEYRNALARRKPEIVRAELHAYLKARQLPIDPSSPFYREAGLAVLKGHVKAYEMMGRRQAGDDIPTPQPSVGKGPLLSEAYDLWQKGSPARGGKQSSPHTLREAERAVRYFTQWHGDLRLGDIGKEKARDFRNALAKMPTRMTDKQRALPLRELLAGHLGVHEAVHAASVNKYLNLLSAIISAAEKEGLVDAMPGFTNPFKGLALTVDRRGEDGRRAPFAEGDLKAIFGTGVYSAGKRPEGGGGDAAYWFPIIALLSGARLNEIAQLRIKDLRQDIETGIWLFDIGTDGGRAIKTASSRRYVPVHPELERLGLLSYRQSLLEGKPKGGDEASLWPDIKSADPFYRSTAWSKWFGRFLRIEAGVTDSNLVFHSFRHSFKRMARDAGVLEETHDALTGHVGGGGVGRGYGGGFGLKALADAMSSIKAPQAVRALTKWSRRGGHAVRRK
ncbi:MULTISPECIES: site-specific integrase [unclassified Mesorhizobium]|uniref:site-specific integrase n=1 Tax=unclassified Mesorhizobium TaxID=325217 RepID=UPI001FEF7D6D|nr:MULTISPECIES: site-specific integrase [unclassified Mesorhizobium]